MVMEKKNKGYLSLKSTILLCLCLAALIVIGDRIRDEVVGKSQIHLVDLSSQCQKRPIDTVLKNTDGTECICQADGDCTQTGCVYDGNGMNKTGKGEILTCCTSWEQQCIVYNSDGTKKSGCCHADPKKPGSFFCNAESKNCTAPCQQGSVPGSGCRFGRKKYCCEFDGDYDAEKNTISVNGTSNKTDVGFGYCSIVGPECSPCLYKGHPVLKDVMPCTNADATRDAEGCCYDGTCMLKSCPKVCTIRNEPANEGQVCDPQGGQRGSGCCSNGSCLHIDPEGKCPSPCRSLRGTVVAEGKSCSTVFGTDNGICIKGFCHESEIIVVDNTSTPSSTFKKLSLLQNEPEEEYILSQRL